MAVDAHDSAEVTGAGLPCGADSSGLAAGCVPSTRRGFVLYRLGCVFGLQYLPVSAFASVMGLTALSIAWNLASVRFGAPPGIATAIGDLALVAFVANAFGYAVKWAAAPEAVLAEFRHPIAGNLFGTVPISLLLLPVIIARANLAIARGVWAVGAAGVAVLAWLIITRWMSDRQQVEHATPAWIVPIVGLVDIPIAMPALGLGDLSGIGLLGFCAGLFFAIPLFTLILSRLVFQPPMPEPLRPTLLILLAPASVGFSANFAVTHRVDRLSEALYMVMVFLLAVLLPHLRRLFRSCPFRVSWWSVSFPLASAAAAALRIAIAWRHWANDAIALGLLILASAVIGWLTVRTTVGLARGELRTLST